MFHTSQHCLVDCVLNYSKSGNLGTSCQSAVRSVPDQTMIPIFFLKSFETHGWEVLCEKIRLNVIAYQLAILKPMFSGHRGTLIELSFVIQGKCKPLFCLSCSWALPLHSQLLLKAGIGPQRQHTKIFIPDLVLGKQTRGCLLLGTA